MMYVSLIAVATLASICLLIVSCTLRSKSVAILNLIICAGAGIMAQPWNNLHRHPPADPDGYTAWFVAVLWTLFSPLSICGLIYVLIVNGLKSAPKRGRRRRKRMSSPGGGDGIPRSDS
jgi:hypothetical protein